MKRLTAILISILLVCLLLAGCTPKDTDTTESGATPGLTEPDYTSSPEGSAAPSQEQDTGMYNEQPTIPEGKPIDPEEPAGSEGVEAPDPPEDSSENLSASELESIYEILESENEGGLEVEDDYSVEIGDNVGVGGN